MWVGAHARSIDARMQSENPEVTRIHPAEQAGEGRVICAYMYYINKLLLQIKLIH